MAQFSNAHTKVIATVGPATSSYEMLESLKIGQTEFNWTTQDFDKQLPVSMESALTACKGDHETDTTTMVWTLRL